MASLLQQQIDENPVYGAIEAEAAHEASVQVMKYPYIYPLSSSIAGQAYTTFLVAIEGGTDFMCMEVTGSAFSYDASNATTYPIPNSGGLTYWAGRGLTVQITDSRSGRSLCGGEVPFESIFTPGYGVGFQKPKALKYFFQRNSNIKVDIRNNDNSTRTHYFNICFIGYKYQTAAK